MSSRLDDLLALLGFVSVLAGVYLWLGLPAALILFGIVLIYIGWKIEPGKQNEPNQTASSATIEVYPSEQ